MAILFGASALLQFNDPNPFIWITFYLLAAAATGLATCQKLSCARILSAIVLTIGLLWEVHYLRIKAYDVPIMELTREWHMTSEAIVAGREFYALLWIVVWMLAVIVSARPCPGRTAA